VTERVMNARYQKKKRSTSACKHAVHSARDGQHARYLNPIVLDVPFSTS